LGHLRNSPNYLLYRMRSIIRSKGKASWEGLEKTRIRGKKHKRRIGLSISFAGQTVHLFDFLKI
jgi:hypothetical protein